MANMFIVLDGLDGCGKGEQIKRLHNFFFELDKRNIILTTREPTYGTYGVKIRKILKEEKDPYKNAELLLELYTKDREEHLEKTIKPFLFSTGEINKIVLCDRYYHSTYAFQQAQGIPFERIYELQKDFLKPTITFILDLNPELALSRIQNGRANSEKFEKLEIMGKIRKNFLDLKNKLDEKIFVIDASKSKEEVFNQIVNVLKQENLV
ncbi:MAG: dTMP kinase [Nanoarchaeota archaeon]|nr:dTMP kinase [Nanoarchaeota archaeon]